MKSEKAESQTAIHQQVVAAREGKDPRVIARLFSGWVVFGERQFVRGYVLLLPDPVVPTLNALGAQERCGEGALRNFRMHHDHRLQGRSQVERNLLWLRLQSSRKSPVLGNCHA